MQLRLLQSEFDFEVIHRTGMVHQVGDAVSSLPTENARDVPLDRSGQVMLISDHTEPDSIYVCTHFTYEK